jgi:hypothetical protein
MTGFLCIGGIPEGGPSSPMYGYDCKDVTVERELAECKEAEFHPSAAGGVKEKRTLHTVKNILLRAVIVDVVLNVKENKS